MRIIAGKHRGRRLSVPAGSGVRPSADRAREGLFNTLAHGGFGPGGTSPIAGALVLDAFAGTGALGLEALSRGAAAAIFLEAEPVARDCLARNIAALGEAARATIVAADATRPPPSAVACTLVFLDPPYAGGLGGPALTALAAAGWIAPGALCVVEIDRGAAFSPPAGFAASTDRRYGRTRFALLRRALAQMKP